jgi:hypothetical protein
MPYFLGGLAIIAALYPLTPLDVQSEPRLVDACGAGWFATQHRQTAVMPQG